jgi:hypothetical protein
MSIIDITNIKGKPVLIDNIDKKYDEIRFMFRFSGIPPEAFFYKELLKNAQPTKAGI